MSNRAKRAGTARKNDGAKLLSLSRRSVPGKGLRAFWRGRFKVRAVRCERMISLSIENLVKRFGETVALNRINLRIEPGEIFFLLGPSGCGKTTLLRCIAGFYVPEEGRI